MPQIVSVLVCMLVGLLNSFTSNKALLKKKIQYAPSLLKMFYISMDDFDFHKIKAKKTLNRPKFKKKKKTNILNGL